MKNHRRFPAFFGGIIIAFLIYATVATALAASGTVTFNAVGVVFNGMEVFKKGESLQTASGADIPSSIRYTDDKGGNTTYVPIREIADTLQMPIVWDASSDKATVHVEGDLGSYTQLYTMPLYGTDWSIENCMKEVKPIIQQGGTTVLASVNHQSAEAFTANVPLTRGNGRYVSVTVTNHNNKPVEFGLGRQYEDGGKQTVLFPTQIPAGEMVTRTIEVISPENQAYVPLYVFVGYDLTGISWPINITVSAVQFEG